MFAPSDLAEDELRAAQSVPQAELRAKAKERAKAMGDSGSPRSREEEGDRRFPRLAAVGSPARVGN